MDIQTLSIVIGTKACNADCAFCVSHMTGLDPAKNRPNEINWQNFEKACRLAEIGGTTTVLLTGKGEPTLYPGEITAYLELLESRGFPFIELQTNGIEFGKLARGRESSIPSLNTGMLTFWKELGLNTIALSAVDYRIDVNKGIYSPEYGALEKTIEYLHELGFMVRLCIMMLQGGIDSPERIDELIAFARENDIEQLTVRPIRAPKKSQEASAKTFVKERGLTAAQEADIMAHVRKIGTPIMSLMHGATVYDIGGQNLCLSDCLTNEPDSSDIRTLIFYGSGRLTYSWEHHRASTLLR